MDEYHEGSLAIRGIAGLEQVEGESVGGAGEKMGCDARRERQRRERAALWTGCCVRHGGAGEVVLEMAVRCCQWMAACSMVPTSELDS